MQLQDLHPDEALKALLDGLRMQTSDTEFADVAVYAAAKQPNTDLGDAFIVAYSNGFTQSLTKPSGLYKGGLAIAVNCKLNSDGTAKTKRMSRMIGDIQARVDCKSEQGFFFEFNPDFVIMPITTDPSTGYATTILNVDWHTT